MKGGTSEGHYDTTSNKARTAATAKCLYSVFMRSKSRNKLKKNLQNSQFELLVNQYC